jgi:hypothetical protein
MEQWAELRREHFVRGVPIKELARRTGLARNTIRAALRSDLPSRSKCPERPSKLEPFREEIQELLRRDPPLTGVRVRELLEPLGFDGGKTIVDDYLREVRPLFVRLRDASADVVPPWGVLPVGSWEALGAGAGRPRPAPPGVGRGRVPWVLARWGGRTDLQQGSAPARRISRSRSGSAPASPASACCSAPRPNGSHCSPMRNAKEASTRSCAGSSGSRCWSVTRVGYTPLRPAGREPDVHARLLPL